MRTYLTSDRVEDLRLRALSAVDTHVMDLGRHRREEDGRYCWDDRQLTHFYEAWLMHADAPTTLLRRVMAEADMIAQEPVVLHDDDLIIGQPDITPLTDLEKEKFLDLRNRHLDHVQFVPGRLGHMALDYKKLLELGIEGILAEIDEYRAKLDCADVAEYVEKTEFYDSCEYQLRGLLKLQERYAEEAKKRGNSMQVRLLERVPRHPARTFHEALQSMHFYSFILRDLFSCGRPDQYLIDYYRQDLAAGILTEEQALELIDCFNLQYTFYTRPLAAISYIVGGQTPTGEPVENELTWLFLQSIAHVRLPYPGVGLAVSQKTSTELLDYALTLLAQGLTHPAIFNDEAIPAALVKNGIAPEDARIYVHSTCVEITPCYTSGFWATSPYISCPQVLMDMLKDNLDCPDVDTLYQKYRDTIFAEVKKGIAEQNIMQLERRRNGGESPLAACLVHDCLARGKSIDQGGARYNHILPDFVGAATTIDSLAAIEQCVFLEKKLTLAEFYRVLEENFENNEALRQYIIHRCPHFGNNDAMDEKAKIFHKMLADSCSGLTTFRNGHVIPGVFSFDMHEQMGRNCMATPDGRKAGEAFNGGSDPVSGRDISGPTAAILSDTAWDHSPFLGGIAVNIRLNTANFDEEKCKTFRALIQTFLARGGFEIQVNTVSPEVLEAAIADPEHYQDLLVRIGGFSDFFIRQTPQLQRELLARSYHGM